MAVNVVWLLCIIRNFPFNFTCGERKIIRAAVVDSGVFGAIASVNNNILAFEYSAVRWLGSKNYLLPSIVYRAHKSPNTRCNTLGT